MTPVLGPHLQRGAEITHPLTQTCISASIASHFPIPPKVNAAGQGQANRRRALKAIPATGRPGPLRAASSLQSSYEAPSDICPINKPDASHLDYYTEPRTMPHGLALIWPTSAYQPPCRWADRDTQEHTTSGPRTRTLVCSS